MARYCRTHTPLPTIIAAAVLPLLLFSGCHDGAFQPPLAEVAERWILVSVAGDDLPAVTLASDSTWRIATDTALLRAGGSGEQTSMSSAKLECATF